MRGGSLSLACAPAACGYGNPSLRSCPRARREDCSSVPLTTASVGRGGAKAGGGPDAGLGGFGFAIAPRSGGFQGVEQTQRGAGDLVKGRVESGFVRF